MDKITKNFRAFAKGRILGRVADFLGEHEYHDPSCSGADIFANDLARSRTWGVAIATLFFLVIFIRLFVLQVQEGFVNLRLAEGNRLKSFPIIAPRGLILDDSGRPLVENEPIYQLTIQVGRSTELDNLDPKIFEIIGLSREEIKRLSQTNKDISEHVVLKDKIPRDEAMLMKSRLSEYTIFEVRPTYIRRYTDQSLCHVLGYTGKVSEDDIKSSPSLLVSGTKGKSALENTFDQYLQGIPGSYRAEVDVNGRLVRRLAEVEPIVGNTLETSIDKDLQDYITEVLGNKVSELQTKGTAIAMDPRDGTIRALVSLPGFDNSKLSYGISPEEYKSITEDQNMPLLNRAIAGTYPPGSSIKPFIATTGLADGVVDQNLAFDTPSEIVIGQWRFPDWKDHGYTDIRRAIAESNNIFFMAVGGGWGPIQPGLGAQRIKEGLSKFGFGEKTGVDLLGEGEGFIPTPEWKKKKTGEGWFTGNTYNMSIGQGDLMITPLQLANGTAIIANGGKLFEPHFVKKIVSPSGEAVREYGEKETLKAKDVFPNNDLQVVREGMRLTITEGSAYSTFGDFPLDVAGKTGTAQFGSEGKTHAWFTSFAPYDNPELVITVLIEGGGEGYQTAAPVARDIYQWWMDNRRK